LFYNLLSAEVKMAPNQEVLAYYSSHGVMTDPRGQQQLLNHLPTDLASLANVVQGLLLHPFEAGLYGVDLTSLQRKEVYIRPAAEMLRRIKDMDPRPLTDPRPPAERLIGNCRDHAVLFCSMLRSQSRPTRVRAGFANYLTPKMVADHWIAEVWDAAQSRWLLVDPQIDDVQRKAHNITTNTYDLKPDEFFTAARTWSLCRAKKAKSGKFGFNRKLRGWNYIKSQLLHDLTSLNKIELLPMDIWWDIAHTDYERLEADERKFLDKIAEHINALDESFDEVHLLYESDPRLGLPVESKLKLLGLLGEPARSQPDPATSGETKAQYTLTLQPSDRERLLSLGGQTHPKNGNGATLRANLGSPVYAGSINDNDWIVVRGAQQHNLKHIDVNIPRNKIVVLTGVSGSGKSSLAFDTLYAEGQRRYVESLSSYVRRFLDQMDKPKVDYIGGLSPAIAIEQKSVSKNPRSTVATVTEIMDYLRVLFSRTGTQHCPQCGRAIEPISPQTAADTLALLPCGTRFQLLAPMVQKRKGDHTAMLETARKDGFTRARIDGIVYDLIEGASLPGLLKEEKLSRLTKNQPHNIELVVDRLVIPPLEASDIERKDFAVRLIDSVETSLRAGKGQLMVDLGYEELLLSEHNDCPHCQITLQELTPGLFSFNAPSGMCPECNGLGSRMEVDPNLIIEHPDISILDGASRWYGNVRKKNPWHMRHLQTIADHFQADLEMPWKKLPEDFRHTLLWGSGDVKFHHAWESQDGSWKGESNRTERGAVYHINRLFRQTQSEYTRRWYMSFMSQQACPVCGGSRLCAEARNVTVGAHTFANVLEMTIEEAHAWVLDLSNSTNIGARLSIEQLEVVGEVLKELQNRLRFMLNVGLHYLNLNRSAPTLSGGEGQRIRLASQLGCGLVGVLYILDEPSIGLHSRDQRALLDTLQQLRDLGNTVLVVEHDAETMRTADWLVDMGPGAGILGGRVVACGTPDQVAANPSSLTGRYLSGDQRVTVSNEGKRRPPHGWLTLSGARLFNLKNITTRFPLGTVTCITGVSGSGKSSLISETLFPALSRALMNAQSTPGPYDRLDGLEQLDKVIDITQDPIGRTPRSNPATYVGIFDDIRQVFAQVPEARARGYMPARFSFNVKGGRCEACTGHGLKRIEMHFLPDVWVICQECKGARYNRHTLEITFRNKNIADVLNMDVQEALEFFSAFPKITRILQTLQDVGLDYIKLGQSATTLSGGEAQRIKLARELGRVATGETIYILDEPTTGLHFADVQRLLDVLHRLADANNTVIVIEHNLDVVRTADWIIDLGPEGGARGGYIIAEGTPEQVSKVETSYTGKFLDDYFKREKMPS
jgi:excinuclease ABC subunit A